MSYSPNVVGELYTKPLARLSLTCLLHSSPHPITKNFNPQVLLFLRHYDILLNNIPQTAKFISFINPILSPTLQTPFNYETNCRGFLWSKILPPAFFYDHFIKLLCCRQFMKSENNPSFIVVLKKWKVRRIQNLI